MRTIWKGHIRFSLVTIPIEVYGAIETGNTVRFRQLHVEDHGPVGYQKICKECKDVLKKKDIVKGFEYEPDQYAILTNDDLAHIRLKSNKVIEIEAFIQAEEVHPLQFETAYFVAPGGDIGKKTYALLRSVLLQSSRAAIGRIILRDREDVVMIAPYKNGLIMYKLRYPYEIRSIDNVPGLESEDADADQLKLAETLVNTMSKSLSEVDFEDRYRDALLELVEQKVAGKEVASVLDEENDQPVVDIMQALKESIEQAKKKSA